METINRPAMDETQADKTDSKIEHGDEAPGNRSTKLKPHKHPESLRKQSAIPRLSPTCHQAIYAHVGQAIARCFGSNLVFGFIFGSVAKGRATRNSDIDTMIVVEELKKDQCQRYLRWLAAYHRVMGMTVDHVYPAVIVTRHLLDETVTNMASIKLNLKQNDAVVLDHVVWAAVLSGPKRGTVGDMALLSAYAKRVGGYPEQWRQQILREAGPNPLRVQHKSMQGEQGEPYRPSESEPGQFFKRYVPFTEAEVGSENQPLWRRLLF